MLGMFCIGLGLLAAYAACSRWTWAALLVYFVVPVALTVWFVAAGADMRLFSWVKLYSIIAFALFIQAMRVTRLSRKQWGYGVIWFILALNIVEAVAQDIAHGVWINAAVGVLLVLTQPGIHVMGIGESPRRNFEWALPRWWIVTYTAWNLAFVWLHFQAHISDHVMVLGIPLVIAMWRPRLWMQLRVFTLAFYGLCIVPWIELLHRTWWETAITHDAGAHAVLVGLAAACAAIHLAVELRTHGARFLGFGWKRAHRAAAAVAETGGA